MGGTIRGSRRLRPEELPMSSFSSFSYFEFSTLLPSRNAISFESLCSRFIFIFIIISISINK